DGATRLIRFRPEPAPVGIDDGPADRQPHPGSARLRGVESLENAFEAVPTDARAGVAHDHENAVSSALLGADRQLAWPGLDRTHCLDRIQDQVQPDLLQLNTIALNGRQRLLEAGLGRDSISPKFTPR